MKIFNATKYLAVIWLLCMRYSFGVSPFELPWMNHQEDGAIYRSNDYPTGIFVVEAYFRNCPYCHQNAPKVNALASEFASEPRVQVLDVGIDRNDSDYDAWIAEHQPNHPVLKDEDRVLISQLGTTGYPSTYVMDCKGRVVAKTVGLWNVDMKNRITTAVNQLLGEPCHVRKLD